MDIHVVGPLASPAERAAVDAVLGPPASRWTGGERSDRDDARGARTGHAARSQRHLLLPALHAVQARIGWISQPALDYISRRLSVPPAEAYGVATFYALLSTRPRPAAVVHVCDDIACLARGAEDVCLDLERRLGPAGEPPHGAPATWLRSPCLGMCERAPAALFTIAGEAARAEAAGPVDAAAIVARLEGGGATPSGRASDAQLRASVPQLGSSGLRLLARVGVVDPTDVIAYRAAGGYLALEQALELGPKAVTNEVTDAALVGRGGAAFPTGRKWAAVAAAAARPHYAVCNADESEPGTFKDRILLEEDPFAVLEALTIQGFATGSERGFIYLRGEYPLAAERLSGALDQARRNGFLGNDILGSGWSFDIELRLGAGAYVCGEETALFESIEGHRGEPRNKPPYPVAHGLFGKPTAINNVETLVNVLPILVDGSAAHAAIGTPTSTGTKLYCLSGSIERPGLYEVPFGATLGDLLDLAGGLPPGRSLRAVLLGGAAGSFVGPEALDTPLTFEGARAIDASLGSGVVMAFDDSIDLLAIVRRIARFFRDESCGQCVPCRVGTVRQEELVARLEGGRPIGSVDDELALLDEIAQAMRDASICGLGQTAASAVQSALRRRDLVTL